jgi:peroxiredoxin
LTIIGIHTPETNSERNLEQLRRKVEEAKFKFPIVVDNDMKNWNIWGNSMWPSVYLIDKHGYIRYWWYGELNWQGAEGERIMRRRIEELLAESTTDRLSASRDQ